MLPSVVGLCFDHSVLLRSPWLKIDIFLCTEGLEEMEMGNKDD